MRIFQFCRKPNALKSYQKYKDQMLALSEISEV